MNETPLTPGTDLQFHSWRKARRSTTQGSCVEVGVWRKSGRSANDGACIEVRGCRHGGIAVRDSKDPAGPKLRFLSADWSIFVGHIRAGRFDLS